MTDIIREKVEEVIGKYEQLQVARPDNYYRSEMVDQILEITGYVDEDAELPEILYSSNEILDPKWVAEATQQDMLTAGWRKHIEVEK